jgi:hypothetical protein
MQLDGGCGGGFSLLGLTKFVAKVSSFIAVGADVACGLTVNAIACAIAVTASGVAAASSLVVAKLEPTKANAISAGVAVATFGTGKALEATADTPAAKKLVQVVNTWLDGLGTVIDNVVHDRTTRTARFE